MSNTDLAIQYLNAFCAGDLRSLEPLLADELCFRGPFHTFRSASGYLESLRNDPPEKAGFEILSITENKDSVAVFYEYQKPDRVVSVAQLFTFEYQKIRDVLLIFDGRGFG
ncbi:MAG: nuclear transport factor 2 family protein [Gammaproteobacteria bacterium]|nr:nuclear transport factor 2 family protein [Gammaproteobacteria bacterium]